jgi:hypothetical protein
VRPLIRLGCRLREVAEPGLDPALVPDDPHGNAEVYVHLPNFLVLAAERA